MNETYLISSFLSFIWLFGSWNVKCEERFEIRMPNVTTDKVKETRDNFYNIEFKFVNP
jgi:hypothetical protein